MMLRSSLSLCVASLVLGWPQPGHAQAPDTIDRPVTIYVAGTAGGGIDLYARLVGRHLGRHIPGKPTVTVQLMPGAGGIRAANFLAEQAPRDGTAITTFAGGPILEPLIGARNPGYDMSQFTWIGAVTKDIGLCMAWGATPFKTIDDVKKQQMVVAGTGAGSETDTWPVVLNDVLGTKFKLVTGYVGSQETILAIERGEAHGRCVFSHSALKIAKPDWLRDNKINVLVAHRAAKEPRLPRRAGGGRSRRQAGGPPTARAHGRPGRHGAAVRGAARAAGEQGRAAAARLRRDHAGPGIPRRGDADPGRRGADHRRGGAEAGRAPLCDAAAGDRADQEAAGSVKARPRPPVGQPPPKTWAIGVGPGRRRRGRNTPWVGAGLAARIGCAIGSCAISRGCAGARPGRTMARRVRRDEG